MSGSWERFRIAEHVAVYFLASLAVALLLIEQSQLSSQAGVQVDILAEALVQQTIMALLLFGLVLPAYGWTGGRWPYVLASVVFAGYSGTKMIAAFTETLELVPTLDAMGVPVSDYQGTFYLLALASAVSYVLMVLLLRGLYERLGQS